MIESSDMLILLSLLHTFLEMSLSDSDICWIGVVLQIVHILQVIVKFF